MQISIIGTGYVGIVAGVCFAKKGIKTTCIDVVQEKVDNINNSQSPIYEPGLQEILQEVRQNGNFGATTNWKDGIFYSNVSFISVGTPMREDGSANLEYIQQAAKEIGQAIKDKKEYHVVVVRSTVPPGTTDRLIPIIEQESGKKHLEGWGIAMSPEFLREGLAVEDFMNPDRFVIGSQDPKAIEALKEIYSKFTDKIAILSTTKAAELVKYTSNSLLATKISFTNEIGDICKLMNVDVYEVMNAVGLDHRLGPYFLNAGPGFGGSCFPKDVHAIVNEAEKLNFNPLLLKAVLQVNEVQPHRVIELAKKKGLPEKIAILGLAFKPGTDDIRETPALKIINDLKKEGKHIIAYDPKAMHNMEHKIKDIEYAFSAKEAVEKSEMVIIVTHWDEFKDEEMYKGKKVIDCRHVIKNKEGMDYEGLCW